MVGVGDLNGVVWRAWRVWDCGCGCGVFCGDGVDWGDGLDYDGDLDYAGGLYHGHVKSCDDAVYSSVVLHLSAAQHHGSVLDSSSPLYSPPSPHLLS